MQISLLHSQILIDTVKLAMLIINKRSKLPSYVLTDNSFLISNILSSNVLFTVINLETSSFKPLI